MDTLSKEERSALMSKIRGKNTQPEKVVRKFLFSKGYRYRINDSRYPGSPDIVLPKCKVVIFVHGCFWHGHENCSLGRLPKSRTDYWKSKIEKNKERDLLVKEKLEAAGWRVIIVWNCQIRTKKAANAALPELLDKIKGLCSDLDKIYS
jgi:DNA mismatch endonuclease (patch repair protein)